MRRAIVLSSFLSLQIAAMPLCVFAQGAPTPTSLGVTSGGGVFSSEAAPTGLNVKTGIHKYSASDLNGISSLSVGRAAIAIVDFGSSSILDVTGNISNAGKLFAISTNPAVNSAQFNAQNIFNLSGAVLSSVLPASLARFNLTNNVPLNLSLVATNNIVNYGSISSSANLALSAGNIITNQGTIFAVRNISTMLGSGVLTNAGNISSISGNINISTLATQNIIINNANGTIKALLGALEIKTASTGVEKLLLELNGGNIAAKALNLTNLNGITNVSVDNLAGTVNVSTGDLHVLAATPNLSLGHLDITGDPTFYNTQGDITLSSDIDLRPVNFQTPAVALAIVASGNIIGSGITKIDVSSIPNSLGGSNWPGDQHTGGVLLVAGASVVATPADASVTSVSVGAPPVIPTPGDTSNTLTISGASSTGGNISLSGVSISTQAGLPGSGGQSGNVSLVAFSAGANTGNINIGNITTGEYQPAAGDNSGLNGTVSILAEGNISTGTINTSGNVLNPTLMNGIVTIASANILMLQSSIAQPGGTLLPAYSQLQSVLPYSGNSGGAGAPGQTAITVTNTTGLSGTIYIDALGPGAEAVTVSSVSGNTVNLGAALVNYHANTENVYVTTNQIVVNPGAGNVFGNIPVTQNGGLFAPDPANLNNGSITIGGITSTNDVVIKTNGTVTIAGNIGLTANPPSGPTPVGDWIRYPAVNIVSNGGVTVNSGATLSSQISGCGFCPSSINIVTPTLVNNGTISGGAATSSPFSNNLVSISSSGSNLVVSGTGSIEVPNFGVIELAAADNKTLNISNHTFSVGAGALVILNAQGPSGRIITNSGSTLTFGGSAIASQPAIISINTPFLNLRTTTLNATTPANFAISSGFTDDKLQVVVAGSSSISTSGNIRMRAADGQNLEIKGASPANLTLTAASSILAASGGGKVSTTIPVRGTPTPQKVLNPSGEIQGVAFQPYVGGLINPGINSFTSRAAYPYQVVLSLLGQIAAEQQFDMVSTYTQQASSGFVPKAAKQVGLKVSAGVFVDILTDGTLNPADSSVVASDSQLAIAAAQLYGNVKDIVVGNENIVGGANPTPSINTLNTVIGTVQAARSKAINPLTGALYTASTLPVTTRQKDGVLNLVATNAAMVTLVNGVDGYIYGNFYPFFDEENVVPQLVQNPGISQSAFQTLVLSSMNQKYQADLASFAAPAGGGAAITTKIRVGETGWATEMLGYNGTMLPQQSTTWATWYYAAMQYWSKTNGVPIAGYFEGFNEPDKGIDGANPNNVATTLGATMTPGSGQMTVANPPGSGTAFNGLTPQSVLLNPPTGQGQPFPATMEVQNILTPNPISGNPVLSVSGPINQHNTGETLHAGTPQEPFFGIWVATGNIYAADGSSFTLTGTTRKYPLPLYPSGQPPTGSVASPATPGPLQLGSTVSADTVSTGGIATSNLLSNVLGTTTLALASAARTVTTILPTDINPEIDQGKNTNGLPSVNSANSQPGGVPGAPQQLNFSLDLVRPNVEPNQQGSIVSLPQGNSLLMPDHSITVQTPLGNIKIDAGAAVLILQNEHSTAILNLYDEHAGHVSVSTGDKYFDVPVGRQVVLTSKSDSKFDDVNLSKVGYRNLADTRIGKTKSFVSEFSVASALTSIKEVSQLLNSNRKGEREKALAILKTAAAMNMMSKNKEPFKPAR